MEVIGIVKKNRKVVTFILVFGFIVALLTSLFPKFVGVNVSEEVKGRLYDLSTYIDETGELDFEEINIIENKGLFDRKDNNIVKFKISNNANWVKIKINNEKLVGSLDRFKLVMGYAAFGDIELYMPTTDHDNAYIKLLGGINNGRGRDDEGFVIPMFNIPSNIDVERDIYIRTYGRFSANYEILLINTEETSRITNRISLFLGLVSGVIISMFMYNLILGFVLKDKAYFWYVFYIFSMFMYQSGITGSFRIIDTQLGDLVINNAIIFSFLAIIGHLSFAWYFLNIKDTAKSMVKYIYFSMFFCILGIIIQLFGDKLIANFMGFIASSSIVIVVTITVIISNKNKNWISKYYILAVGVLFVSVGMFSMRGFGVIEPTMVTSYYVISATAMESMLYSFALAERIRVLKQQNYKLLDKEKELSRMAITDEMTGLFNRRYFEQILDEISKKENKEDTKICLLMMDIDNFKNINDTYGHQNGDEIIKKLGEIALKNIRYIDYAFRVGGEEFSIILRDAKIDEAYIVAERIRKDFSSHVFTLESTNKINATISIGVVEFNGKETGFDLFGRADTLLYKAKREGKNCTKV